MTSFLLLELRRGRLKPLGPKGVPSGIYKEPVEAPPGAEGGAFGDEQGDRRRHGGPDKALHAYPVEHYEDWIRDLPDLAEQFRLVPSARTWCCRVCAKRHLPGRPVATAVIACWR